MSRTTLGTIAALFALLFLATPSSAQISTNLGQANLTWQQRFMWILPLVKPDPKDPVVVNVDGAPITAAEVEAYAKTECQVINCTSTEEHRAVYRDAIDNLINRRLLVEEAKRRKIEIPEEQVAARAREFQLQGAGGEQLAKASSDPLLLSAVHDSMIIEKMLDGEFETAHVRPTDKQIEQYYNEHKDLFIKDPGQVRLSHIAVRLPDNATDAQKEAAHEKIMKLYKEAETKVDFATLARENSEDQRSAQKGGDLGYFSPGQLPPVVDKIVFSTPVGHLTTIIDSNLGYSFIKVTERRNESYQTLKEAKPAIAQVILNFNEDAVVRQFLQKLAKKAHIEPVKQA